MSYRTLGETAFLALQAYEDDTDAAEQRGWRPLGDTELPGVPQLEDGIQDRGVGTEWGENFRSVAHVYVGELDGERTAVLAFRGTDEGNREVLFELGAWDDYYDKHASLVNAFNRFVTEELADGSLDGALVTGHSLGAVLAQEYAAHLVPGTALARATDVVTFGSPGAPIEVSDDIHLLNLVHSDDGIANVAALLEDLPDWAGVLLPDGLQAVAGDLVRSGVDLLAARPEGEPLDDGDRDELFQVLLDGDEWDEVDAFTEHQGHLYQASATALDRVSSLIAGSSDTDAYSLWSTAPYTEVVIGGSGADSYGFGRGAQLVLGESGNDRLSGGSGNDLLDGSRDNDRLLGGSGKDTLSGSSGDDWLEPGTGNDYVHGGGGIDTVRIFGEAADFTITARGSTSWVVVDSNTADGNQGADTLNRGSYGVELLRFDDASLDLTGSRPAEFLV